MIWITLAVAALAILQLLALGALVEMFRDLQQIRLLVDVDDAETRVDMPGLSVDALGRAGFPVDHPPDRAVLLYVSERCFTCKGIVKAIGSGTRQPAPEPGGLLLMVDGMDELAARRWLHDIAPEAEPSTTVLSDPDGLFSVETGLDITPAAVRFVAGVAETAVTVPSPRRLEEHLAWLTQAEPGGHDERINADASGN